ncbi:MAG: RuBisCO large subunit C-terminal-like domain-containing protein [Acidimicrobiales bacterium]
MNGGMIVATYELAPAGSAAALALEASLGQADGPPFVRGEVVAEGEGRATVAFPADNWSHDLTMLLTALAGEVVETAAFTRCRLVGLELPAGWLPGPAVGAPPGVGVGAILKPSLGLSPREAAATAAELAAGGAVLVKDDELLGDAPWCPLEERVRAVSAALGPGVTYCANVSGSAAGLLTRAARAVELGATGLMVNLTQGFDAVRALREEGFGAPILAHRVGSGGWTRNERFGVSLEVTALLERLAGADFVLAGAFAGKLFDADADVAAQLDACRRPLPGAPHAAAGVLGGGVGPHNAGALARQAGGDGLILLCGQAAYRAPGGPREGVAATRAALEAAGA